MAAWYVYSGAGGAGTGADWANAFTTLAAAIAAGAAGDTYYLSHDHAETAAATMTLTAKGTNPLPDRMICVNRAGSVPPVAADLRKTASITTTGAFGIVLAGIAFCYGVVFNNSTGASGASFSAGSWSLQGCQINLLTTSSGSNITRGSCVWVDTTVSFGAVGQGIQLGNALSAGHRWSNSPGTPAVAGATIPTDLFKFSGTNRAHIELSGLDLSSLGSGKTIVAGGTPRVRIINCKLGAAVTVADAPTSLAAETVDLIGCHSSGNVRRDERYAYQGTLTTETTIVRTGGASDGTTAFAWKIVPTTNNERDFPFETFEGTIWGDAAMVGVAKTLTVHIVCDNVTLTDAEVWLEADYLGSGATPVASMISDGPATPLTAGANQAASTETWTTTGLTTPIKQKLEVTFTPQMTGPIRWKVKVASASATPAIYVCPKAELS